MSLLGRKQPLPARTVLIPVEHRPPRGRWRLGRWLLGLLSVVVLVTVGAVAIEIVRSPHAKHASTGNSPPPAPASPRPRPPAASVAAPALSGEHAITRLAGLAVPVYCGGPAVRDVALTFDDGPGPYTARLLAVLRRYHARATFFLVGDRVRYWPRLPVAAADLGAVGDHTWSHANLARLPPRRARIEVNRGRAAVAAAARTEVRLFRTPYERSPAWLDRYLADRGMIEIRWSVDSEDYLPGTTAGAIVRRVAPGLRPGAIVLLHDNHPATVLALQRLLALMRSRHLWPVSVPELLRADSPSYPQLMADNRGRGCVDLATAGRE